MSVSWEPLTQAFTKAINGKKVTHALFTTYIFDPEFFETAVIPAMLPEDLELSDHSGLRRLQLEEQLRNSPIAMAVFFDARREPSTHPWLPYQAVPVALGSTFHGKVIILRLEGEKGKATWVLGAGSANLTRAGWWENIEVFRFTPEFDPKAPPGCLLPDLGDLLDTLTAQIVVGETGIAQELLTELNRSPRPVPAGSERFGVFLPGRTSFTQWLGTRLSPGRPRDTIEVVSPYFPSTDHERLVQRLLKTVGAKQLKLWLPIDRWQSATLQGNAVRMEEQHYQALHDAQLDGKKLVSWCRFGEKSLLEEATPEETTGKPPRFLHAKLFRIPGRGSFIGSVNFSHDAFDNNFEAGFLVPDHGEDLLTQLGSGELPEHFLEPEPENRPQGDEATDQPKFAASYHWGTREFSLCQLPPVEPQLSVQVIDLSGEVIVMLLLKEGSVTIEATEWREGLENCLISTPRLRLLPEGAKPHTKVWVQQEGLDYRPLPMDVSLDVWRMLEIWRGLLPGSRGSSPGSWEVLRPALAKIADQEGEDPLPPAPEPDDIFEEMASIHSGMHLLRSRIQKGDERTVKYYLSGERPDTLATLLKRLEQPAAPDSPLPDPVQRWIMLHWVKLIAADRPDHPDACRLAQEADRLIGRLFLEPAFEPFKEGENRRWLDWVSERFQRPAGIAPVATARAGRP